MEGTQQPSPTIQHNSTGVVDMRTVSTYVPGDVVRQLPIDSIAPQGYELRKLDPDAVEDLERSIRAVGILQPIMVRPIDSGRFEVVFGNHRLLAARRADLHTIPALVRETTPQEAFLLQVTENLHRNVKMNPVAEARGYKQLLREGWSIHRIGSYVGKSDSYICDRLRLLDKLAPEIQESLEGNGRERNLCLSRRATLPCREQKEAIGTGGADKNSEPDRKAA